MYADTTESDSFSFTFACSVRFPRICSYYRLVVRYFEGPSRLDVETSPFKGSSIINHDHMPWITTVLLCLSVTLSFVSATAIPLTTSPLSTGSTILTSNQVKRDDSHLVGVTPMQRTILSSTVIICVFLLGLALGTRVKQVDFERFRFIHCLVVFLTWMTVFFTISVGVIGPGLGIRNAHQCRSSIIICIIFYLGGKMAMYQFLIERAHVIRSAFLTRYHDRLWMTFTTLNILCIGGLLIVASLIPEFIFNPETGTCNIGFNHYVAVVGITIDITFNLALTSVFIWLLWPVIRVRVLRPGAKPSKSMASKNTTASTFTDGPGVKSASSELENLPKTAAEQDRHESIAAILNRLGARTSTFHRRHRAARHQKSFFTSIRTMLWRNIVGSTAMLAASMTNGVLFFVWHERPSAWLCLSLCVMDMSFGTLVVHWLSYGGSTIDSHPSRSQSTSATLPQNGHVIDRSQIPYSDSSVDAELPELKTYEEVVMKRPESPTRPEQSHGPEHSL